MKSGITMGTGNQNIISIKNIIQTRMKIKNGAGVKAFFLKLNELLICIRYIIHINNEQPLDRISRRRRGRNT